MNPASADDGDAVSKDVGDGAGDVGGVHVMAGKNATGFYFWEPGGDVSEDVGVIVAGVDEGDGDGLVEEVKGGGGGIGDDGGDEVVGFGDFLEVAEGSKGRVVDEGVDGERVWGILGDAELGGELVGNPFEVVDGDDGEGEVGDLGLAGEVNDGRAAEGADFDEGVVGLEDADEVVVEVGEVEEAGDFGKWGEHIVEFLAGGVVFGGVLAVVGGI